MNSQELKYLYLHIHHKLGLLENKPWNSMDGINIFKQHELAKGFKNYLLETRKDKSFWINDELKNIVSILSAKDTQWRSKLQERADTVCNHNIKILGLGTIPLGENIDWYRDPVTKSRYPLSIFDIVKTFWNEDSRNFDPKFRAELNRMQFLVPLGIAYISLKDEKYAEKAKNFISDWIDSNPPLEHLYWRSALEISIRLISWIFCLELCIHSKSWDDNFLGKILLSIYRQTKYIEFHLQNRKYLNNHIIGEAAVLSIVGIHFPEIPDSTNWVSRGIGILQEQIHLQTYSDGVSREKSTHYHRLVLDFLTMVLVFCHKNNYSLPSDYLVRLEKMYEFLLILCRPDGTMPLIGDEDGGRIIRFTDTPNMHVLSILSTGSVLFNRGDMKYVSGTFHEDSLWLLGVEGYRHFDTLSLEKPDYQKYQFIEGGINIIQNNDAGISSQDKKSESSIKYRKDHLFFLCGPQGMGHAGHSHADALSIGLYSNGIECLIDPGTYKYNFDPHWRNYFRGTSAHNTISIDHQDQSTPLSIDEPFGWKEKVDAISTHAICTQNYDFLEGYHNGYKKLNDSVVHRRSVMSIKNQDKGKHSDFTFPNYYLVTDYITGNSSHDIELNYHFSPCQIQNHEIQDNGWIQEKLCGSPLFNLAFNKKLFISTFPNHTYMIIILLWQKENLSESHAFPNNNFTEILEGWISKEYGSKFQASVLNLRLQSYPLPCLLHTIIIPGLTEKEYQSVLNKKLLLTAGMSKTNGSKEDACIIESMIQIQLLEYKHIYYWSSDKMKSPRKIEPYDIEMDGNIAQVQSIEDFSLYRGLFLNSSSVLYHQQKFYPRQDQDYIEFENAIT